MLAKTAESATVDSAALGKMHASTVYTGLIAALEALKTEPIDYNKVIKTMAATAIGRLYLVKGKVASPIFRTFAAGRKDSLITSALNAVLAVDESRLWNQQQTCTPCSISDNSGTNPSSDLRQISDGGMTLSAELVKLTSETLQKAKESCLRLRISTYSTP